MLDARQHSAYYLLNLELTRIDHDGVLSTTQRCQLSAFIASVALAQSGSHFSSRSGNPTSGQFNEAPFGSHFQIGGQEELELSIWKNCRADISSFHYHATFFACRPLQLVQMSPDLATRRKPRSQVADRWL